MAASELARMFDQVVTHAARFHEFLRAAGPRLWGEDVWDTQMRQEFMSLAAEKIMLCDRAIEAAAAETDPGIAARLGGLREVRERAVQDFLWTTRGWPGIDTAQFNQAMADYEAGDVLTPEQAIREFLERDGQAG